MTRPFGMDGPSVLGEVGFGYQPLPGVYDEMIDPQGQVRAPWLQFLGPWAAMDGGERRRSFAVAQRYLRESGVVTRFYDEKGGGERPWPLEPMPLVIASHEWKKLKDGIVQRASLMESILADAYGEATLVRDGLLPAAVLAGHRDFLRPLSGVRPGGGRHLQVYAADIGRGPDGRWWVLHDRTQAPSGMGYAVENRLALSRAFPDLYRNLKVERLAGFFNTFRDELTRLNAGADTRVAILSPGPYSETYFEHATLARYLGFLLVEGEDLVVREDALHVRTISGLRRIDVLYRRLDGDFADPLELSAISRLGVPGMVRAVRRGNLILANALGSGLLENPALMGFVPKIAQVLLGQELMLPNIATWWCGQEAEKRHVAEHLGDMVLAPAHGGRLPGLNGGGETLGAALDHSGKEKLRELMERRGCDLVGQEVVKISTMPAWHDGRLVPRPFVLRLFAVQAEGGWTVMPGGFCRIADNEDARAVSLQQGARTADVWVLSDREVERATLLPAPDSIAVRRTTGALPSRAADNLFWLSRNLERAEGVLRLLRALITRVLEYDGTGRGDIQNILNLLSQLGALPEKWARGAAVGTAVSESFGSAATDAIGKDVGQSLNNTFGTSHRSNPESTMDPVAAARLALSGEASGTAASLASYARSCATAIRDRMAPDAWAAVRAFADRFTEVHPDMDPGDMLELTREGLQILSAFSGLSAENMIRRSGWRFLELGRRIERGVLVSRYARSLAPENAPAPSLDLLLELCDCQITYRSLYPATARLPALDLLLLDPSNPRSLAGQVEKIEGHLRALPVTLSDGRPTRPLRLAARLCAHLANERAEDLAPGATDHFIEDLHSISNAVASRFFIHRRGSVRLQEDVG